MMARRCTTPPAQCYGCRYGEVRPQDGRATLLCVCGVETSGDGIWRTSYPRVVRAKRSAASFTVAQLNRVSRPKWCPLAQ